MFSRFCFNKVLLCKLINTKIPLQNKTQNWFDVLITWKNIRPPKPKASTLALCNTEVTTNGASLMRRA